MSDYRDMDRRILQLCSSIEGPTLETILIPFGDCERADVKARVEALVAAGKLQQVGIRYRRIA